MSRALRERGARVLEYPTITIRPPADRGPLRDALARLGRYDWAVFTSVNGVRRVREELEADGRDLGALADLRLAAIGPSTADALREGGLEVEVVPEEYRAEALAGMLAGEVRGRRVLLARAAEARDVLPERLRDAGAEVDEVPAYETLTASPEDVDLGGRLATGDVDWLTFTASSTVRNFVRLVGADAGRARVACIGPVTAGTARELGLPVDLVASDYTIPGLVRALAEFDSGGRSS